MPFLYNDVTINTPHMWEFLWRMGFEKMGSFLVVNHELLMFSFYIKGLVHPKN